MKIKINKIYNPEIFPQANDIYKLMKYIETKVNGTKSGTFDNVKIINNKRQVLYYKSAGRYLSLLDESEKPTKLAELIFSYDKKLLFISFLYLILSDKIFYNYFKNRDKTLVMDILKKNYKINSITAERRINTIKSWIKWCEIIISDYELSIEALT